MTVNQIIETALSSIVKGNIWPLSKPVTEDPSQFIVYNPENEYLDYGDNQDTGEEEMSFQIHWYAKGHANYIKPRKQIRDALRSAGFLIEPSPYITYESEDGKNGATSGTGWTHMTISCRTEMM